MLRLLSQNHEPNLYVLQRFRPRVWGDGKADICLHTTSMHSRSEHHNRGPGRAHT